MSRTSRIGVRSAFAATTIAMLTVGLLTGCGDDDSSGSGSSESSSGATTRASADAAASSTPSSTPSATPKTGEVLSESEWDAGWIYGPDTEASNYYCQPLGLDDDLRALLTRPRLAIATQGFDVCKWKDTSDVDDKGFGPGYVTLSVTNRDDDHANVAGFKLQAKEVISSNLNIGDSSALITLEGGTDDVQVLAETDTVFIIVSYKTNRDPDLAAGGTPAHQEHLTDIARTVINEPDKLTAFVDPLQ